LSYKKQIAAFEESVYYTFQQYLLPLLPAVAVLMACFYHPTLGRRSFNVCTLIGLWIFKGMMKWTTIEAIGYLRSLEFLKRALGLSDKACDWECYVCEKTYYTFQKRFFAIGGPYKVFVMLTYHMLELADVDTSYIRVDSTIVVPNAKILTRYGLFRETISHFLRSFLKEYPQYFREVDIKLWERYDPNRQTGYGPECLGGQEGQEKEDLALPLMARDAESLTRQFCGNPLISDMKSFQILTRLVREQCHVLPGMNGGKPEVILKDPKDIPSDSLQSPYDDEMTFCGHKKMKGRKFQMGETCSRVKKKDMEEPVLNLVIYVYTEEAHVSDVHAIEKIIEFLKEMKVDVKYILVDNAYNTPHNRELAEAAGAELITSMHGGLKDPGGINNRGKGDAYTLADFLTDDQGAVTECPKGQKARADMNRKGDGCHAYFDRDTCLACPCRGRCPVKIGTKRACGLTYSLNSLEVARNCAWNSSPENVAKARQRNGVEGTISEAKRTYGVGRTRVRGNDRVEAENYGMILGMNVKRFHNFLRESKRFRKAT
jgi:hypothetical protein